MIASVKGYFSSKTPFQQMIRWYFRLLAIQLLGGGIIHWARIVEYVEWRGKFFSQMPADWQIATVYFAVIDLVAAVGLWLVTSWGVVIWLLRALSQVVMHTVFADSFGQRPYEITFYLVTIAIYLVMHYYAEKEKQK